MIISGLAIGLVMLVATVVTCYQYVVLTALPVATNEVPVTINNYNSWGVINKVRWVMTGKVHSFSKPDRGTVVVDIYGTSLRSDGTDVYLVETINSDKFPDTIKTKVSGHTWAIKGCRSNAIRCNVVTSATYKFGEGKSTGWFQTRYDVKLNIRKMK